MEKQERDPRFYLFCNAAYADRKEAARLLAADPTIMEARNGIGETALHYLVVENAFEAVKWLRLHGSNVDTTNWFGETPLIEAASLGYLEMCQYLVMHGANPRYFYTSPHGTTTSALSGAAGSDQIEVVKYLLGLLDADEDINRYFSDLDSHYILKHSPQSSAILLARGLRDESNIFE